MSIIFGTLIIITSIITIAVFANGKTSIFARRIVIFSTILDKAKNLSVNISKKISSVLPKRQTYSFSIFAAETYKTLIIKRYIFVVIVLIIAKCYISNNDFTAVKSYSDAVYKEYMTTLSGELTDKKRDFIITERTNINDILAKKDEMFEKYLTEKINFVEYREYINEYNYAYSRNELFARIENHTRYIEKVKIEKNVDGWFVYDTGWKKLFHNEFDIILYVLVLLLFAGIFADEYTSKSSSGGFAQILRTSKNGRKRTFALKLSSSVIITIVSIVIFNLIEIILIFNNYSLPALNAPLLSMQSFADINGNITLAQYFVLYMLIKIIGYILFTLFICALSELFKNNIFAMSVSVAVTLFPALFVYFGLDIFNYFDFTALLSGTRLYLLSSKVYIFGDIGFCIIFILSYAIIFYNILFKAEKDYIK
jgi:hypothetical protein